MALCVLTKIEMMVKVMLLYHTCDNCVTKNKYIMFKVQDYDSAVLYNTSTGHPDICEGWHFTKLWNTPT
jgi:hypothetical protein